MCFNLMFETASICYINVLVCSSTPGWRAGTSGGTKRWKTLNPLAIRNGWMLRTHFLCSTLGNCFYLYVMILHSVYNTNELIYSGSTGKPKGVLHTTGGYLLYAATTFKYVFDYHPGDVYWCTADVGWITGHTYVVYGPLANGATSVIVS